MQHCPLCRRDDVSLEFHHWDYDEDIGVEICRDCHNAIHGGEEGRVAIQQNRAESYGVDHWHVEAIDRLVQRDIEHLPEGQFNIAESASFEEYWSFLKGRYNPPAEDALGADGSIVKRAPEGLYKQVKMGGWQQGRRNER